ncbi:SRGEF factor, partial [Polypterus senegalus]
MVEACTWLWLDTCLCSPLSRSSAAFQLLKPVKTLNGKAVEIAAGLRHALAVTAEKGLVFQWGVGMKSLANRGLQTLPVPAFMSAREPCEVPGFGHVKVKHVSAGAYHSACITDQGWLFVWGSNKYGQLLSSDDFLPLPFFIQPHHFEGEKITLVRSGWTHIVARTGNVKLFVLICLQKNAFLTIYLWVYGLRQNTLCKPTYQPIRRFR